MEIGQHRLNVFVERIHLLSCAVRWLTSPSILLRLHKRVMAKTGSIRPVPDQTCGASVLAWAFHALP